MVFNPSNIEATCAAIVRAVETSLPEHSSNPLETIAECDRKLTRYRELVDAGAEPALVAQWIREVQADREEAQVLLTAQERKPDAALAVGEVREIVQELGGLVGLLGVSDPVLRSRFYEEVGLRGTYDPRTRTVDAVADLGVRTVRVGGGT